MSRLRLDMTRPSSTAGGWREGGNRNEKRRLSVPSWCDDASGYL